MAEPLKIGMLGCVAIAESAMFGAIAQGAPITVAALAARDPNRAVDYARRWNVPSVFPSYEALLAEADVQAIYVPLPNALHYRWVEAALEAGFHVLCEKPIAINAGEAAEMVALAEARGLILQEAFHWRAHPAAHRVKALAESLGPIEHIDVWFELHGGAIPPGDIRMSQALGGGNLFDMGCYCVSFLRMIAGDDLRILSAKARPLGEVDGAILAQVKLPGGGRASLRSSMDLPHSALSSGELIRGAKGVLRVENPFLPGFSDDPMWATRITLETGGAPQTETVLGQSSYFYQACGFASAVGGGTAVPSPARDGLANMRVIDAIRKSAGA